MRQLGCLVVWTCVVFTSGARAQEPDGGAPEDALVGLLETFVDRIADILERVGADLDGLSRMIFDDRPSTARRRQGAGGPGLA